MSVTLASLRDQVRQRADMQNSGFVLDAELDGYINASAMELYDILISRFEDYFIFVDSITGLPPTYTVASSSQNWFTLPTDVYKIRGVDRQVDSTSSTWLTLSRFNFAERNNFVSRGVRAFWGASGLRYRPMGTQVQLLPAGDCPGVYRLWYIPKMTELSSTIDLDQRMEMWAEYIVVDSAIKCLVKEESDPQALFVLKQALIARIESMAANRDAGMPERISDVRGPSFTSGWGFPWD